MSFFIFLRCATRVLRKLLEMKFFWSKSMFLCCLPSDNFVVCLSLTPLADSSFYRMRPQYFHVFIRFLSTKFLRVFQSKFYKYLSKLRRKIIETDNFVLISDVKFNLTNLVIKSNNILIQISALTKLKKDAFFIAS